MIIVTGAAGFIGSCMVEYLNEQGYTELILVDDFSREDKEPNLHDKHFTLKIERNEFLDWLSKHDSSDTELVIHLGARTDTVETDDKVFDELNLNYSKALWKWCTDNKVPLIYASSAATYGAGENGYSDEHSKIPNLRPLNAYARSKQEFDMWVLQQQEQPPSWAGLKFFNVYGPNEYHKGRMASVVYQAFQQIKETGQVKLFRSHRDDYEDGEQARDFIYVKDVVRVIWHLHECNITHCIFNVGTGHARSFRDLAKAVFSAMEEPVDIDFIDMPEDIRDKYQYFTEADISKLRDTGYDFEFTSLEAGVTDYIQFYLTENAYY